jgi:hypothetical protein
VRFWLLAEPASWTLSTTHLPTRRRGRIQLPRPLGVRLAGRKKEKRCMWVWFQRAGEGRESVAGFMFILCMGWWKV